MHGANLQGPSFIGEVTLGEDMPLHVFQKVVLYEPSGFVFVLHLGNSDLDKELKVILVLD